LRQKKIEPELQQIWNAKQKSMDSAKTEATTRQKKKTGGGGGETKKKRTRAKHTWKRYNHWEGRQQTRNRKSKEGRGEKKREKHT